MSYNIEKQPNGQYKIRVWSKRDALGNRKTKQISNISGLTQAKKKAKELEYEIEENLEDLTFIKLDDMYYNERKDKVSITTLNTSYKHDRQRARDFLGDIKISKINTSIIQQFIDSEQRQGLRKKTVKNHVAYILAVINWGVNYDKIQFNPIKKLHYKEDEEEFEATTLTLDQIADMLIFLKTKYYNLYIPSLISILTSARRGEVLGLTWNDIDFENNIIYFRNNLVNIDGKPVSKKTLKTKTSKRAIAMANFLKEELLEHKSKLAIPKVDNHVCSNVFLDLITPDYLTHTFHDFAKNNLNIKMREHDLRHTFSQLILDNEQLLIEKSKIMGHSNTEITKNVYTKHNINQRMFLIVNTLGDEIKNLMCDKNVTNL